ncbi:MAG: beta strand repeat-containing protein, partial [Bryobacteraceae bacterium]
MLNNTTNDATIPLANTGTVTLAGNGPKEDLSGEARRTRPPTVSSVSPNSGAAAGGTAVTITGTNFAAEAAVTFGGTAATNVVVLNSTAITATTPAGSAGAVTVTAFVNGRSGSLTNGFTYISNVPAPPSVTSVSPSSGSTAGGTAVTITGTNFAAGATVTFGGTAAANVVVVNGTTITATTPVGSAGAVTVTVTNPGAQSASLANGFSYVVAASTTIAYVQGNAATPQTSQTKVTVAFTAAQAAGDLNVVVVGWDDTTAVVSSVVDTKGNSYALAVGPTIVSGSMSQSIYYARNIAAAATGANTVTVTFSVAARYPDVRILEYSGADPSIPVDVTAAGTGNSASSGTASVATTNPTDLLVGANYVMTLTTGPGTGFTKRLITSPDGDIAEDRMVTATGSYSATAPLSPSGTWIMQMVAFRTPSGAVVRPTVSSVSPNGGSTAGGTAVTITGANFAAGATVAFGSTAATKVVVVNSTTITATTPAGSAGAATVTVTVNGLSGSLASGFTYTLPPTVSGITPNSGSTAGGTAVTITGTNFAAGAAVSFGGTAASNVVVVGGTEITATTPAGSAGAVTVTVTNLGAQSGTLANGFTYLAEAGTATPAVVSHFSESNSRSSTVTSPWHFYFHLADPATSGNAIVVACQFQGNAALAIADDKSDSYTNAEVYYNSANNQSIVIAEAFHVAAGAYNLTATWNADTSQFQCVSSQIANVIAADGPGVGNGGSGTSVTAGSMTPTVTGDLVYQVVASLSGTLTQASFTAGSQSNIAWSLESADLRDGMAVQTGVYSSASAINPAMTLGTSATWISAAVLLQSGAAGGVPSGLRVGYSIHENVSDTTGGGGTGSGWLNPMKLQIPCVAGATIAAIMDGGGNNSASTISSITDTNGNLWSEIALYTYGNTYAQAYYAANVACTSPETLTVTSTANTDDNTIVFYVILGASTTPLDTYTGGGQSVTSDSATMTPDFTLTPSGANELVLSEEQWDYNT